MDKKIIEARDPASAETLVLLPGFGFHAAVFENLIQPLTQELNLRIILIDLPGYVAVTLQDANFRHCEQSYAIQETCPFSLATLINQLLTETPQNAWWFGWSLGGLITLQLALSHPKHLRGFITLGTSPKFLASNTWPGVPIQTLQTFKENLNRNFLPTLYDFLRLQGKNKRDHKSKKFLEKFIIEHSKLCSDISWGLDLLQVTDLRFSLKNLRSKGLSLFAQYDQLIPVTIATEVAGISPYLQTDILPEQGHASFLLEPALFLNLLKRFIYHSRNPS